MTALATLFLFTASIMSFQALTMSIATALRSLSLPIAYSQMPLTKNF